MTTTGTVVEFLGLPGSGKTAVAHETVRLLRSGGAMATETFAAWNSSRAARLTDHLNMLAYVVRLNPGLLREAGLLFGSLAASKLADRTKMTAHWLNRCGHYEHAVRTPGIHLVDQGVLQVYWSLHFAGEVARLEAVWPHLESRRVQADVVVVVRAKVATVLERLYNRPGITSRLERALEDPHSAMRRAEDAMDWVLDFLSREAPGPLVLEVDNDRTGAIDAAAAELCANLSCD